MKIFKKIILSIFACVFLCAALYYSALIIIVNFADLNKYTNSISRSIEQTTGFKFSCENIYFKKSLSPYLKIHLSHIIVLYPNDEVFLKLKETDLQVKILPLLIKKIEIKDVYLTRPIINITLYKDFSTSLEKYIDTSKTFNTKGFKLNSEINDTICENYKIKFKDDSINKTFYLEGSSLLLKDFKLNDKAHFAMKGAVFENKNEYINYDIDITANLNSQKKHFTFSPFKTILNSNVKGSVLGHLKIDKENKITGNLNINNLSLKIDNVISRDNTADLIFNGDEAEINSVIHTSDTDSVDIKGKFALGKKKYIDLNTNAKNINIENLIKIVSGITKILNIDNPLNDISGKGILDAKFNINSDFKKLKSSGSANIINASFSHKLIPYSLTGINASVNLENNNISVDEAAAMLNGTPVKIKGRVNEDVSFSLNAHSENLNLLNFINLFKLDKKIPVTFTNGKLSVIADITGVLNNSYNVKSKIYLSDLKFTDKKNNIPAEIKSAILDFQGNDKKYRGLLLCKDTSLKYLNKEISTPELKFLYDENKITIPNSTLNSPLNLIVSVTI
ncbi:MAG: hypothetical protein LUH05_03890, partial [Candidatus Gastranaerophilales bacterium]|nr:hypothetical protein [Candidatus Gastranaerophilales bacterium]